jgi:hypothetical protein
MAGCSRSGDGLAGCRHVGERMGLAFMAAASDKGDEGVAWAFLHGRRRAPPPAGSIRRTSSTKNQSVGRMDSSRTSSPI